MTFAEMILFVAGGAGIYFLLRPLQRRLESRLIRTLRRRPHGHLPPIDVTDFTTRASHKKEDHET